MALRTKLAKIFLASVLLLFLGLDTGISIWAQLLSWSSPKVVFQTEGWTFHLATTADESNRLIAIWQYNPYKKLGAELALSDNDNDSLFVSRFDGKEWSSPMEVLLGRIASERLAVVTTSNGVLHVFSQSSCLWYSQVPMVDIERTQRWTKPICLAEGGYTWPVASVLADGRMILLYSAIDAQSFYLISSNDNGITWSSPSLVLQSDVRTIGLATPAMVEDSEGVLHLVWSNVPLPDGYPASGISYIRSVDGGVTWSKPHLLAGPRQSQPTILTDQQGYVYVAWNGDAGDGGRYFVSSSDRGLNWNVTEKVLEGKGGLQLPPGLAVDTLGVLHAVFTDQERLVYMQRTKAGWSVPQELIGPATIPNSTNLGEIDSARLHILNGNELHALYTRFGFGEVLHQMREIDAPRKTPIPPLTPEAITTESSVPGATTSAGLPTPTLTSTASPASPKMTWDATQPGSSQQSSMQPLIISTALAALLVGAAILTKISRRR